MKVISGKLKGRNIKGYDILGTRPTMDRVKESVFAMIQNNLSNSVVLDLFAGSGNLGIEAISNGAKIAYFNDKNIKCLKVIEDNLCDFNIKEYSVLTNMDYKKALSYYKNNGVKFDIIFLDPPYKEHIINEILKLIKDDCLLNEKGLVICELTSNEKYIGNEFILYKERNYGEKQVLIYKLGN